MGKSDDDGKRKDKDLKAPKLTGAPMAEKRLTAAELLALDLDYSTGKDSKGGYVTLEHFPLPEELSTTGEDRLRWRVNYPYSDELVTDPGAFTDPTNPQFRLGGLTLKGLDLFRPIGGKYNTGEIQIVHQKAEGVAEQNLRRFTFEPELNTRGVAVEATATADILTREISCTCSVPAYSKLPVCPHQMLLVMYIMNERTPPSTSKSSIQSAHSELKLLWVSWMKFRGAAAEGERAARLAVAFHKTLMLEPTLDFVIDSATVDADLKTLHQAALEERNSHEIQGEAGRRRIPAIDKMFQGVRAPATPWSPEETSLIPEYQEDLVLTRNANRALFGVSGHLRNLARGTGNRVFGFYGDPGTGKDTVAMTVAAALNRPVVRIDCSQFTNFSKQLGTTTMKANEQVVTFEKDGVKQEVRKLVGGSQLVASMGQIGRALSLGYVIVFDEIINADPRILSGLHQVFQEGVFTIDDPDAEPAYKVHEDAIIFCTWNPYADNSTKQMPGRALTDRMITFSFDPDSTVEQAQKLAKYFNTFYADGKVTFSEDDMLPVATLINEKLPAYVESGVLQERPTYRTARKVAEQLYLMAQANIDFKTSIDFAIDPLIYLCNQEFDSKNDGVSALKSEFMGGEIDWASSEMLRKFNKLRT